MSVNGFEENRRGPFVFLNARNVKGSSWGVKTRETDSRLDYVCVVLRGLYLQLGASVTTTESNSDYLHHTWPLAIDFDDVAPKRFQQHNVFGSRFSFCYHGRHAPEKM